MNIYTWLVKLFNTRSSEDQVHNIKNAIAAEGLKTSLKLGQANKAIEKNITTTHNIAKALGILNGQ